MTEEKERTEEQQSPPEMETQIPPAPEPAPEPTPEPPPIVDAKTVEEGKAFAILSYALSFIGIPFFIVPLIMRNNAFALYHAKQCLVLWLAGIAASVLSVLLSFICIGLILGPVAGILLIVLCIMGIMNAAKGLMAPVPVIGKWGEEWFKGLTITQ